MGETPADGNGRNWSRGDGGDASGSPPEADDARDRPPIPLDGDVLLYTGATASVAPERIEPLLRETQAYLRARMDAYRRRYETAFSDDERRVFLVPDDHWAEEIGADLSLPEREIDAVRRAHAQQLRRLGSQTDRREELETALEIREAVVIGRSANGQDSRPGSSAGP